MAHFDAMLFPSPFGVQAATLLVHLSSPNSGGSPSDITCYLSRPLHNDMKDSALLPVLPRLMKGCF